MAIQKKESSLSHSDFSIPLLKTYTRKQQQAAEQTTLKAKYDIVDQEIYVVEKKNPTAQIVRAFFQAVFTIVRVLVNILLIVMATIGLAALVYPNIRRELIETGVSIFYEVKGYFEVFSQN